MSRASTSSARNLSLTEELEKLEQSITLTLQEIDHNFSRAHRIVTTSILPIVEQYAEHSKAVWDGSKFWKQFFEASANVSLSGYEEPTEEESTAEDSTTQHTNHSDDRYASSPSHANDTLTPAGGSSHPQSLNYAEDQDDSLLESPSLSGGAHSTPRVPYPGQKVLQKATFADYPSPYEALKREVHGEEESTPNTSELPSTPGRPQQRISEDPSATPHSSPFNPTSYTIPSSTQKRRDAAAAADPLLHRVLDKNYRLRETPHTSRRQPHHRGGAATTAMTPANKGTKARWNGTPMSSPPAMAPQLHSEIFSSPVRASFSTRQQPQQQQQRTPGVSVQTPMTKKRGLDDSASMEGGGEERLGGIWDSDSEGEEGEGMGMSPPKTMQFHIPQSRLLQTPAREASKRIVEDLLLTAGGNVTEEDDELEEDSPSVVRRHIGNNDDSF
ncbi:MAG: DASH complex subunit ask1 [Pycnora praestabilis]|nr:MAG: DASH complex subunit ask1 [Pycnora praestabilis]